MYPRFIVGRQGVYMIGMVGYIVYFSATCRVYLRVISRPPNICTGIRGRVNLYIIIYEEGSFVSSIPSCSMRSMRLDKNFLTNP